jgi:GT2 family glycosyltransferase
MGLLAANDSLVSKRAWRQLGGYDEDYAAGGEDAELGRRMLANGYMVSTEPALSVFHSHGLGLTDSWRQLQEWRRLAGPQPFDEERIKRYRHDLP